MFTGSRQQALDRDLAIEVRSKDAVTRADALPRFEREAKAASVLNRPHILHIYDLGYGGGVNAALPGAGACAGPPRRPARSSDTAE